MSDFRKLVSELRRPALMMRAVACGLAQYRRGAAHKRLIGAENRTEPLLRHLAETEARLEETRKSGVAGYSVAAHIAVLIALIAETRATSA